MLAKGWTEERRKEASGEIKEKECKCREFRVYYQETTNYKAEEERHGED